MSTGRVAARARARAKESFLARQESKIIVLGTLAAFLSFWEGLARSGMVHPYFFAGPVAVAGAFVALAVSGELLEHLIASLSAYVYGFVWAMLLGIPVGLLLGVSKKAEMLLNPYVMALYSMPRIAFYPLMVVWFGLGINSKALLVFFTVFFPVCINTWSGVKTVDPVLIRAGRSFGASRLQILTKIVLPFSMPFVVAGIRIGAGLALIAVYVGEMLGSNKGIGVLITQAGFTFKADQLFVGVVLLAGLGVALNQGIGYLERRIAPWRQEVSI